jgi:hypothetical protein
VSLVRALLVAHVQMMWNRARRGVGRRGLLGLGLVVVIMLLGALPLFGLFGFLGSLFARAIEEPLAASLMGTLTFGCALGFGVIGGLLGGARQLTWEAYRSFPVPFRTLFVAETVAGFGDLVALGFVGASLAMGSAFVWVSPLSIVEVALLFTQLALWVLFTQHLVGALAVAAVRQLRRAMIALVIAGWAGLSLIAAAAREVREHGDGADYARLEAVWERLRPLVDALPTVLAVRGMVATRHGAFLRAAALEAPLLATTLALAGLSYQVLRREATPRLAPEQPRPWPVLTLLARSRLLSRLTAAPRWAVARLQLGHVAGSLQGRFGLVIPLIIIVVVRGPLAAAGIGPRATLPGSVIYVAMAATQFHFNQFGLDAQGAKTLFLMPVTTRELLLGKAYGLLGYAAIQNLALLTLLAVVLRPAPMEIVGAAFLAAALAAAHVTEGHFLSAAYPRQLSMRRMNAQGLSTANLLPLLVGMLNAAFFGSVYAASARLTQGPRALLMGLVLLVLAGVYRVLLPRAASFVTKRREAVVEILS